ncbi:MAG: DUF4494 domain-containing protein [Bacteroidales bacterium]|nr:DUF4494 domain-containing protein [Muribaculaceae bacterium]MCI6857584.1 DUF4494 domain-containing protein [Bacteroidales bacterium]MDY4942244.1 DUF4494 domain-containing protein [Candidatus Limisoma sp.]MDD7604926.1 DUF4494 domain-containing protein [Bacteroidales bacterium]MDD7760511.1 DUF4494 domain-containing protein [Bacteroidales bacterium]
MATWFECKVKYDKMTEDGSQKTVTEPYLVDALSFTEAEARITEEITPFISGEFKVTAVKRTNTAEIFWKEGGDKWYKVKVNFCTIDEKTGKEKKTPNYMMVQAIDFKDAYDVFMEGMKGTMADFEISQIVETMIMDVYQADLSGAPKNKE